MSRKCSHKRAGIVTNVDPTGPFPTSGAHASQSVCARQECIEDAVRRVAASTNMTANFYSDVTIRAARKAREVSA